MAIKITSHTDLLVYQKAMSAALKVFELSKSFPKEETYSLTDQIRRASRAVHAMIAEGWRRRRYEATFCCKLNEAEGEAGETQSWLESAVGCKYVDREIAASLYQEYHESIAMLVSMINSPEKWTLDDPKLRSRTRDLDDPER